jgi:hypothetical protein
MQTVLGNGDSASVSAGLASLADREVIVRTRDYHAI